MSGQHQDTSCATHGLVSEPEWLCYGTTGALSPRVECSDQLSCPFLDDRKRVSDYVRIHRENPLKARATMSTLPSSASYQP